MEDTRASMIVQLSQFLNGDHNNLKVCCMRSKIIVRPSIPNIEYSLNNRKHLYNIYFKIDLAYTNN